MLIYEVTTPNLPSSQQQRTIARVVTALLTMLTTVPAAGETVVIEGSGMRGSGVVVGNNKIVTNCHLFKDTYSGAVYAKKEMNTPQKYRKSYTEFSGAKAFVKGDLCMIQVNTSKFDVTEIDNSPVKAGDPVTTDNIHGTSQGNVKNVITRKDGMGFVGSSAQWEVGASGGALLRDGKLVGITTYITYPEKGQPTFWAVSAKNIEDLDNSPIAFTTSKIPMYANVPHQVEEQGHFA